MAETRILEGARIRPASGQASAVRGGGTRGRGWGTRLWSLLPRSPAEAAAHLRKALAIYRRIGSPDAQPVQDTLDEHGL